MVTLVRRRGSGRERTPARRRVERARTRAVESLRRDVVGGRLDAHSIAFGTPGNAEAAAVLAALRGLWG
jgi:hypothetical protein